MRIITRLVVPAIGHLLLMLSLIGFVAPKPGAQTTGGKWQQVMRGDGFVIDVDAASLSMTQQTIGATFRMVYSKSESIGGGKFKSRIDKYEFDNGSYRIMDSRFFDSSDRDIPSLSSSAAGLSKPIAGTAARFLAVARNLPPFGRWKVLNYTYLDGSGPTPADSPELADLQEQFYLRPFGSRGRRKKEL